MSCPILLLALLSQPSPETPAGALVSGPPAGHVLPPARVYVPLGPDAGKEIDASGTLGSAAGAFLFIHELSRNTAPMVREFERLGVELELVGFRSFAVLLFEDRNEGERRAEVVSRALGLERPLVLSIDGLEGPGGFALNRKCTLTLVTARDGKVLRSIAYTDTGPADTPALRRHVEETLGSLEDAYASLLPRGEDALRERALELSLELHRLRRQLADLQREVEGLRRRSGGAMERGRDARAMRRDRARGDEPRDADRETRADRERADPPSGPRDAVLRAALARLANKFAGEEEAGAALREIEERAEASPELAREALEMLEVLVRQGHGSEHARKKAGEYIRQHGGHRDS